MNVRVRGVACTHMHMCKCACVHSRVLCDLLRIVPCRVVRISSGKSAQSLGHELLALFLQVHLLLLDV